MPFFNNYIQCIYQTNIGKNAHINQSWIPVPLIFKYEIIGILIRARLGRFFIGGKVDELDIGGTVWGVIKGGKVTEMVSGGYVYI